MIGRPTIVTSLQTFHELVLLAFFFAMRSCEYLVVKGDRRTQPLRKRNISFYKDQRLVPHSSPDITEADWVTVHFEFQKKDDRDQQLSQNKTDHPLHCPVRAAAAIIRRLESLGASDDTLICTYLDNITGHRSELTAEVALRFLRTFIGSIDCSGYGLTPDSIGLHSIRSSAAMAMYRNDCSTSTIMLIGRWSSDAFLRYIRPQVLQFAGNTSSRMLQNPSFFHVPDAPSRDPNDPRTRNRHSAAAFADPIHGRAPPPGAFSLWR
jgi:hypothetical protein